MPANVHILEQPESLRKALLGSVAFHVAVAAALLVGSFLPGAHRESWGDLNSGGPGSLSINVVNKIPLPARAGQVNPLANDTESMVPTPPPKAKAQPRVEEPEPEAVPIPSRKSQKRPSAAASAQNRYRAQQRERPNQVYSSAGQALVSPMIGQTGSGGVGVGTGSPFGSRYGYYVQILRDKVARNWHTGDVDPRLKTAPPVIVTFTILRDGTVRDVSVAQRSGTPALDYSAQRAILDSSPFPALPAGYEQSEAHIEFWFELRR